MTDAAPIGVFDSGVGGLSVLRELRVLMPHEHYLYLADTAHMPYGVRADDELRDLTARAVTALHQRGVKAVVVACNTASAFSLQHLRERFAMPIIGLEPAVKPAALATRSGVIGVLATRATIQSARLQRLIDEFATPQGVQVLRAINVNLVPLVEAGKAEAPETRQALRETLRPLAEAGADQLVLGCTHYPFLAGSIRAEFGERFALVDSGRAVARHTRNVLERAGLLSRREETGQVHYLVTGSVESVRPLLTTLAAEKGHNGGQTTAVAPASEPAPLRIEQIST